MHFRESDGWGEGNFEAGPCVQKDRSLAILILMLWDRDAPLPRN